MARARFGTSQPTEPLAGLRMLLSPPVPPWHRPWRDAHAAAFGDRLAGDPVGAALLRAAFGPTWTADFLTVPPAAPDLTLDEELTHLEPPADVRGAARPPPSTPPGPRTSPPPGRPPRTSRSTRNWPTSSPSTTSCAPTSRWPPG